MRRTLIWIGLVAAVALTAIAFVYSGIYSVAADKPHWQVTKWLLETVRVQSITTRALDIEVPKLEDRALAVRGAGEYAQMSVSCHLAPGSTESAPRQGLYRQPPDLTAHEVEPGAAFWVIKHGIKATGMPAWGASHDDETLWSLVAFLQRRPTLDAKAYR